MGVHITKVKSVNLDKWPEGKVEMFRHLSNDLVNSYFEKNMPKTQRKPDSNASNHEVTTYLTNKYVNRKWANNEDWNNDPAWLWENKPKKFEKYVKYYKELLGAEAQDEPKAAAKKKAEESSDEEYEAASKKQGKKGFAAPPSSSSRTLPQKGAPKEEAKGAVDLLNFDEPKP